MLDVLHSTYEHWAPVQKLNEMLGKVYREIRSEKDAVTMLDVFSGQKGLGRRVMHNLLSHRDVLSLYDPSVTVTPAKTQNVQILSQEKLLASRPFDWINLSFALCQLNDDDAVSFLSVLHEKNPESRLTMADYSLYGARREEIITTLTSHNDKNERLRMGSELFISQHTRYDIDRLLQLAKKAGWQEASAHLLGTGRVLVTAR